MPSLHRQVLEGLCPRLDDRKVYTGRTAESDLPERRLQDTARVRGEDNIASSVASSRSLSREDIIFAVTAAALEIKSGPPCNVAGTGEAGPHEERPLLRGVTRREKCT